MKWRHRTTEKGGGRPRRRDRRRLVVRLLYVPGAPLPEREYELHRGATVVGRDVDTSHGIEVPDSRASRTHAEIEVTGANVRVVDRSSNGTFANGTRVTDSVLHDGDVLRVGDSLLLLRELPVEAHDSDVPTLLGKAPSMGTLRWRTCLVAASDASVLVLGESGTGKELVARAVHERSGRDGSFVAVNCSAIPETLAESQLFGHVAGAFTGAQAGAQGYFRAADGGTLFLDEVGDLPQALQPKLLRALEEGCVTPVGATRPIACDVRVVAATHRDLQSAIASEAFRGDLFARIAQLTVRTPPLRDRREDILPLVAAQLNEDFCRISPELAELLVLHDWPFNVRELRTVAKELSVIGAHEPVLEPSLLQERLDWARSSPPGASSEPAASPSDEQDGGPPSRETLVASLERHRGRVADVARELQRSRRQVYRYLEDFGLDLDTYRRE